MGGAGGLSGFFGTGGAGGALLDRIGGSAWDSLWGGITTGNWGGTSKERKNQIHDIRTLRRREYQDMVHSLTQAGLNPVLAVGASPGHATAQQVQTQLASHGGLGTAGISSAKAQNRQAGVAEGKAPSEIGLNEGKTGLLGAQEQNAFAQLANIILQPDLTQANIDNIRQGTRTALALEELNKQKAIAAGASARELDKRVEQYDKFGLPGTSMHSLISQGVGNSGKVVGKMITNANNNMGALMEGAWKALKGLGGEKK